MRPHPGAAPRLCHRLLPISARSEEALVATAAGSPSILTPTPISRCPTSATTSASDARTTTIAVPSSPTASTMRENNFKASPTVGRSPPAARPTAPKFAFVCTGMGPQWWKMCRGLLDVYPAFTESIERSDRELSRYADWSLIDELRRDETSSRMAETEIAQPANFAIQVALAEQLAHFGVTPDAVIGHSAGEVAAHHLAGLLTFEQAIHVIYHRSRFQQRTSGLGRMLAVGLSAESLMQTLAEKAVSIRTAGVGCRDQQPARGDDRRRRRRPRRHRSAAGRGRHLQPVPHRKGAVPHALHGCGEGRPLQRLGGPVVGRRRTPAVLDRHR